MTSGRFALLLADKPAGFPVDPLIVTTPGANALVPVTNVYESTIALTEATRASFNAVISKKGPSAHPSAVDTWLKEHNMVAVVPALAGIVSGVGAALGTAWNKLTPHSALTLAAGAATGIAATFYIDRAHNRLDAARQRHASEQLETTDTASMLRPFLEAPPEQRAIALPYVKALLDPVDRNISAKAAVAFERLAAELPVLSPNSADERAARLGLAVGALIDGRIGYSTGSRVKALAQVIHDCNREERQLIAGLLERTLFDVERSKVACEPEYQRQLYRIIEHAQRGESTIAPNADEARSEQ